MLLSKGVVCTIFFQLLIGAAIAQQQSPVATRFSSGTSLQPISCSPTPEPFAWLDGSRNTLGSRHAPSVLIAQAASPQSSTNSVVAPACTPPPPPANPEFLVYYNSFIPQDHITAPPPSYYGPGFTGYCSLSHGFIYLGDRSQDPMKGGTPNSYRTLQEVYLLPNSATYQYPYSDTGYTNQFYLPSPANGKYITNADYDGKTNDCHLWTGQAKSAYGQSGNFANFTPTPGTGKITANFNGSDSNPLAKPASGAIKWNVSITVDKTTGYSSHVFVSGGVTCYPSHEIIVNNTLVGYYDAPPNPSITLLTNCLILAGPSYPLLGSGTTSSGAVVPVY